MSRVHNLLLVILSLLVSCCFPLTCSAQNVSQEWRSIYLNPANWTDGPELENSPMNKSIVGQAVVQITVSYVPEHGASRTEGVIIIELFENWVPITTSNMISLIESAFFDGIFFHRVIDDFVAQSGDPTCTTVGVYPSTSPTCGSGGSDETIPLEHDVNMSHVDGAIGMARDVDPDSASSQWYLCDGPQHNLDPENRDDGGYATWGIVRDGMLHVRAIASTPTSNAPLGGDIIQIPPGPDRPAYEIKIVSMEMIGVIGDPLLFELSSTPNSSSLFISSVQITTFILVLAACVGASWMASSSNREDNQEIV